MKNKLSAAIRAKLFNVETLEQRILLSADPMVGELVQQYHAATDNHLGELEVAQTTADEKVLLKQRTQENATPNALNLDLANSKNQNYALNAIEIQDFSNFENATGQIVVGDEQSNALIHLGDAKTADGVMSFNSDLLISNPQAGGEIFVDDDLIGGNDAALTINGSGHTTILSANISTAAGSNITINDSLKISGVRTIASGASIQLGSTSNHFIDANSGSGNSLTLTTATTGSVVVKGIVGGDTNKLDSLTIGSDLQKTSNVSFDNDVTINGDVVIYASGTVTFKSALTIGNNGKLWIKGADLIDFENNVVVTGGGEIYLEGNEITLNGGQESVRGTGVLTMRPTNTTYGIAIASPPNEETTNTLNLSSSELNTLKSGFSQIIIGHKSSTHADTTTTAVKIGSKAANQNTFFNPVEIYGKTIEVSDYFDTNLKFQTKSTLALDAINDITIYNEVKAVDGSSYKNITLYSESGKIEQVANDGDALSTESVIADTLTVNAETGIDLSWVNAATVSATNSAVGSGNIEINSNAPSTVTTTFSTAMTGVLASAITLSSDTNNLILNTPILTTSGNVTINSGGTLVINATGTITTTSGTIDIKSKNDLTLNAAISSAGSNPIKLESTSGNIAQNVDITSVASGGAITLTAGGNITLLDGKKISTGLTTNGTITLKAGGNVLVSILEATGAINVETTAGAISDNLTGDTVTDLNLKGATTAVTLKAKTGIGASGTADINSTIASLTATNGDSGGIFINETDALIISSGGVKQESGSGAIIITNSSDAAITLDGDVNNAGTGNLLIQAQDSLTINKLVKTTTGNASLISVTDAILFGATGSLETTGTSSTLDLEAALAVTMTSGATVKTNGGNARLNAKGGNLSVSSLDAKTGNVSLLTTSAYQVLDSDSGTDDVDVTAANLRLYAQAIGTTANQLEINATHLSATTVNGIFIAETDGVIVKEIPTVVVNRVNANGTSATLTLTTDNAAQSDLLTSSNGSIVIISTTGDITIQDGNTNSKGVEANGTGNILLKAVAGNLKLETPVISGLGSINLISGATFTQTADGDISTTGLGTIDVSAATAIVMADGATTTNNNDIRYKTTTGDISLGALNAGTTGNVAILAGGKIIDVDTTAIDIVAKALNLTATNAIATGENPLETTIDNLTASAGEGGMFLAETNAISVEQVTVTVNPVLTTGAVDTAQIVIASDLTTTANGAIVLNATDITLKDGNTNNKAVDATGNGNILFNASAGSIQLFSALNSTAGNISLNSTQNLSLSSTAQITTGSYTTSTTANGVTTNVTTNGSLELRATNAITLANNARLQTNNGNVRLNTNSGDITVGFISAGTGYVSLLSGARILDSNETGTDISANGLRIYASNDVGLSDNALDLNVATLSAISYNGGLFFSEASDITVKTIDAITVNRVDAKAAISSIVDSEQSDLVSLTSGSIVLSTVTGSITLLDGNNADGISVKTSELGHIFLNSSSNLSIQADIEAHGGNISLLARNTITQAALANVTTLLNGTIDFNAGVAITMITGANIQTAGGNVRLNAVETITFSGINVGTGSVSLIANNLLDAGDTDIDVIAANLRLKAISAGTGKNALDINTTNLTANVTTGGLFLNEFDGLTVTELPVLVVKRVAQNASLSDISDAKQSDLISTTGAMVVTTQAGDIRILDGNSDSKGIVTQSGNVLLNAFANLTTEATIENTSNVINLISGGTFTQTATGHLTCGGTIDVNAATAIVMVDGSTTKTTNKDIRYKTNTGDITISSLNAGTANIALLSAGNILDADTTGLDVVAAGANFIATTGIGVGGKDLNSLEINVTNFTASAGIGGIFVTDSDTVNVDSVSVTVQKVDTAGVATTDTTLTVSDLTTSKNGSIVLNAKQIIVKDGNTNKKGITADGTGNILLNASEGNLEFQTAVSSATGNLSFSASGAIKQYLLGGISTAGAGTIEFNAGGEIFMTKGVQTKAETGNVRLNAIGNITLANVTTQGNVSLIGDKILDGDKEHNVIANALRINASSVGIDNNAVDTSVNTLSAAISNGGLFITEANAVTISEIADLNVNRVTADASVVVITDAKQSDLISQSGAVVLATQVGDITITDGNSDGKGLVSNAGNVLLSSPATIVIQAEIAAQGHITVSAKDVTQSAIGHITATGNGTINVEVTGTIKMIDGAITKTANQDIRYKTATGEITLAQLNAGKGNAAVLSATSISNISKNTNLIAAGVNLTSKNNLGETANPLTINADKLTSNSTDGSLFLAESDSVNIDKVSVTVQRVNLAGISATEKTITANDLTVSKKGNIELSATKNIAIASAAKIKAADSNVRLTAGELILDSNDKTASLLATDLRLNATGAGLGDNALLVNVENLSAAAVTSGGLFLTDTKDLTITDTGVQSTSGAVVIKTQAGDLNILDGGIKTDSGNVLLNSEGGLTIQFAVNSKDGNLSLLADAITQNANVFTTGNGTIDVQAQKGITMSENAKTQTKNQAIRYQSAGDMSLSSLDAGKANIAILSNSRIISGNFSATGLNLTADDAIGSGKNVIRTAVKTLTASAGKDGIFVSESDALELNKVSVTVQRVMSDGSNVAEKTLTAGDVTTSKNGSIVLSSKNLTVNNKITPNGSGNLLINVVGNLDVQAEITGKKGAVSLNATGAITQGENGAITSSDGTLELSARNISLGNAKTETTKGNIRLNATDTLTLSNVRSDSGNVSLIAGKIVDANDKTTDVTTPNLRLSANSVGSANALDIDVGTLSANVLSGGLFVSEKNDVTISQTPEINVLHVNLDGSTTGIIDEAQSNLNSGTGHLSLFAGQNITQAEKGNIVSQGTIDIFANGNLNMNDGTAIQSQDSVIRLQASQLNLNNVDAGKGTIGLFANAIIDVNKTGSAITADKLRMNAIGVGLVVNPLNLNVTQFSAAVGKNGLFVNAEKDIKIAEIPAMTVNRANAKTIVEASQSDLISSGAVVIVANGDIVLTDGNKDKTSIVQTGKNNLLLDSKGGKVDVQADVNSAGNVSLQGATLTLGEMGHLSVTGKSTIELNAKNSLFMANGSKIQTTGGNIHLGVPTGTMTITEINAGNGDISLIANAIVDGGGAENNLTAKNLRLNAESIGLPRKTIDTNVDVLSVTLGKGGLFLNEANNITISETPAITVNHVNEKGSTLAVTDSKQSDILSNKNGAIVLSAGGDILLTKGTEDANSVKNGKGNTLLESRSGNIDIQADINSGSGALTLSAGKDIKFSAIGKVNSQGSIDIQANQNIVMANGATINSKNSVIRLNAKNELQITGVNAGKGSVSLLAKSILDTGDLNTDITANMLRIATVGLGTRANPLDLNIDVLAGSTGKNGLFVQELNDLTISQTPALTVKHVMVTAVTNKMTDSKQSGLTSLENGTLSLIAVKDITLNNNVTSNNGDILIESTKGNVFQNARVESRGTVQLQAAEKVVKTSTRLARVVESLTPISSYDTAKNEPFYFWTENLTL